GTAAPRRSCITGESEVLSFPHCGHFMALSIRCVKLFFARFDHTQPREKRQEKPSLRLRPGIQSNEGASGTIFKNGLNGLKVGK
ncbi:MAG: hypothetical protein QME28_10280, partial [Candidatus Saccharicenans sp.]|nr:hypothetical protein [Candidatus Saccharicenans sp.]